MGHALLFSGTECVMCKCCDGGQDADADDGGEDRADGDAAEDLGLKYVGSIWPRGEEGVGVPSLRKLSGGEEGADGLVRC